MRKCVVVMFFIVVTFYESQPSPRNPVSPVSLKKIGRILLLTPIGRVPIVEDIIIRHYHTNVTSPTSRRIGNIEQLLKDPKFDVKTPTVLYAHGYLQKQTDESIKTVMSAYLQRGGYNILLLDWANIGFGNYLVDAKILPSAAEHVGKAFLKLLDQGLSIDGLHFVGHSLGAHLVANIGKYLAKSGYKIPSHGRSWEYWAESLNSDSFLARKCENYDSFLKGECKEEPTVPMGIGATPDLRGNFYLRTAPMSPYGLGMEGAS